MPYKKPKVKLVGEDGNAFAILGTVSKAMKRPVLLQKKWTNT